MPAAIAAFARAATWLVVDQHGSGGHLSWEPHAQCELRRSIHAMAWRWHAPIAPPPARCRATHLSRPAPGPALAAPNRRASQTPRRSEAGRGSTSAARLFAVVFIAREPRACRTGLLFACLARGRRTQPEWPWIGPPFSGWVVPSFAIHDTPPNRLDKIGLPRKNYPKSGGSIGTFLRQI
jgi:hypothetical protein